MKAKQISLPQALQSAIFRARQREFDIDYQTQALLLPKAKGPKGGNLVIINRPNAPIILDELEGPLDIGSSNPSVIPATQVVIERPILHVA